ncbi:MAG: dTMP kinase [Planctomycetota bacterium]|jgi:dTMP kinase
MENLSGKFIVIDGPDGCGKSTQSRMLAEWICRQGVEVESYRDPGTTAIGEKIRQILLNPEHVSMDTRSELLLYMAARAQLWAEKIKPSLENGRCVVLDRWVSSTCAYQGYAGGFGIEKVIEIAEQSLERVWPDLTIILDVDLKTASTRLKEELDRMELKGDDYHQKVRDGFIELAIGRKGFAVIDAGNDIEKIHQKIIETVEGI